jgi:hypothetical protein
MDQHARTYVFSALCLLALAGLSWSAAPDFFQGKNVSQVLMQTVTGDTCVTADVDGETALELKVNLSKAAHLLVTFTFEWGSLVPGEEGLLSFAAGSAGSAEWGFAGTDITRTSGSLAWAFPNVPKGVQLVAVSARVEGGDTSAELNDCALIVTVIE